MKKLLLPAVAVILILTGAGLWLHSRQVEEEATPATHTLRVALWDYGTVSYDKKIVERFEETHPDIRIEVISCPPEYYDNSLEAMLDSGERLDVIYVNQLPQLSVLQERGVPLALDELAARDGVDLTGYTGIEALRDPESGQLMGLPYRQDKFLLYYNKDLFDLAGIAYPQAGMTWEQFRETARALTTELKTVDEDLWGATMILEPIHLLYFMDDRAFDWETDDFSGVARGLTMLLALDADGSTPRLVEREMRLDCQRMFETGRFAMMVHGSWYLNFLATDEKAGLLDFEWGVTERPYWPEDGPNQNEAWLTPLIINHETNEVEAAWEFVRFVSSEQGAEILVNEMIVPAFHNGAIDELLRNRLCERDLDPSIVSKEAFSPPYLTTAHEEALASEIYEEYLRALLGLQTVEESVERMETIRSTYQ